MSRVAVEPLALDVGERLGGRYAIGLDRERLPCPRVQDGRAVAGGEGAARAKRARRRACTPLKMEI